MLQRQINRLANQVQALTLPARSRISPRCQAWNEVEQHATVTLDMLFIAQTDMVPPPSLSPWAARAVPARMRPMPR